MHPSMMVAWTLPLLLLLPRVSEIYCTDYRHCLQCFDAVGWAAGKASGL